jgi:hypothetical protein
MLQIRINIHNEQNLLLNVKNENGRRNQIVKKRVSKITECDMHQRVNIGHSYAAHQRVFIDL